MLKSAMSTIFTTIAGAFFANFSSQVKGSVDQLVQLELDVYENILTGPLKPIPSKSFYTFNLRDVSKVFQGIVAVNNKNCQSTVEVMRGCIHENKRVFGDRLNDNPDRQYLDELLLEKAKSIFDLDKEQIYNSERIIFGDFMDGIDVENRVYRQLEDLRSMQNKIEEYLADYNSAVKIQMPLVMFLDACDHVARIHRIIR
jgi:dynein heavy chain, axonemal